jgi:hypothetical protein
MVKKKKSVKKIKRAPVKHVKKSSKSSSEKRMVRSTKRKIKLVIKNLLLFLFLGVLSLLISLGVSQELYFNLFSLLGILFLFVALAFFLVFLVLLFFRLLKK